MGRRFYRASEKLAVKATFLDALAAGSSVHEAAESAGAHYRTFYRWREQDTIFAQGWEKVISIERDDLELEALRRAVKGVDKPVYRGGEVVGHITDYSDSMLMFLLKAHHPEKYDPKYTSGPSADRHSEKLDIEGARDALKRKFTEITQPREKK